MKALVIDWGAVSRLSRVGHQATAVLDLYTTDESRIKPRFALGHLIHRLRI